MGYLYRYIDLNKEEVIYVGKVMGQASPQANYYPLTRRHEQHRRDSWYKEIGEENIIMQYIECNAADADILETYLINYYAHTGQLYNKGKADWGKPSFDFYPVISGRWITYGGCWNDENEQIRPRVEELIRVLNKISEGYNYNIDSALKYFCDGVREIYSEKQKRARISRYSEQEDFLRTRKGEENEE